MDWSIPAGLDLPTFAALLAVFVIGGVVKGVLGFGLPMISIGMLPMFVPIEMAIVVTAFLQPFVNLGQLYSSGNIRGALTNTWPVLIALVPGVVVGSWYLGVISREHLLLVAGCAVAGFSLFNLIGFQISVPQGGRQFWGYVCGFAAGFVGVLTAINGMIIIIYMIGLNLGRRDFRSSIALLFIVSGLLISSGYWAVGFLEPGRVKLALVCLVPSFLGLWLGNRFGSHLPTDLFRKILLVTMLMIGTGFVIRGSGLL